MINKYILWSVIKYFLRKECLLINVKEVVVLEGMDHHHIITIINIDSGKNYQWTLKSLIWSLSVIRIFTMVSIFLPKDYLLITKVGLCSKYLYSGLLVIRDNFTNSRTKWHQVPKTKHWYKAYNLTLCQERIAWI